ncbi:uncharacterized protein LOC123672208 [Harmonia axyridis]|uniref:uncharacterized protein LOC123672208 n=1 Tax=Harmonia axyridis TaxID=115357 RepID=UPI001E27806D|nr:uncharacterized protein LOC123672208 [Harmonia axyridis]
MTEITAEMERLRINILALTETKRKGYGTEIVGKYVHLYSGIPKECRAKRGVSILEDKKLKNCEAINENIIKMNMDVHGRRITIVGVYAISDDESVTVKDVFFGNLNDVLEDIGDTRDCKSQTGKKTNDIIVDNTNDNGMRLIDLCTQNELKITNGFYKHKMIYNDNQRES